MRGFLLLFRRDLQQRWMLFAASVAMGLFIFGLPLLRPGRVAAAELRGIAGVVAAFIWAAVLANLLGASLFNRDLAENRFAFDFRLPVRPGAIWAARLLAAITTIALAVALVLAPAAAAGTDWTGASAGLDEWISHGALGALAYSPLVILALLLLANPIALAARTRSGWAGVDMLSVALVAVAAFWSWSTLHAWEVHAGVWWAAAVLVGTLLIGVTASSLLQIASGRTETDKGKRLLSIGLLSSALLAACTVTLFTSWFVRPGVDDLYGRATGATSLGPAWVVLHGPTRPANQMQSRFLLAPATGRVLHLGPTPMQLSLRESTKSSIDGSTIAWLEFDSDDRQNLKLLRMSTTASPPASRSTPTTIPTGFDRWALSPDGTSVAVLEYLGGTNRLMRLVVSRIETGEVVAAVQFPYCRVFGDMIFARSKEVILPCGLPFGWRGHKDSVRLVRVDLAAKSARSEPYVPTDPLSPHRSLGLVQAGKTWLKLDATTDDGLQTAWRFVDYETGQLEVALAPAGIVQSSEQVEARRLRDGTFALAINGAEVRLLTYSAKGALLQAIPLPWSEAIILGESSDSKVLLLASYSQPQEGSAQPSFVAFDLQSGTSRPLGKDLHLESGILELASAHSVFYDKPYTLVWFNPETKQLQPLLREDR